MSLNITFHGLDPSEAMTAQAQERFERLRELDPRIVRCRVAVERRNHRHRHGEETRIAIELYRPGGELVVDHQVPDEDGYLALANAFETLRHQLVSTLERQRGRARRSAAAAR
jgi:ribosomal subunit interface protein